ncbi:P4 alpha zinc-binding domain-containing protein [Tianweitania sp. BSSL-BM11]|uniref:P4 alpha zinc-binding domain-containing protein n=1 Tax=Tianweitania aestuarii TaxID=2814886 RepID=A0ABS5RWY8_9HYPH|nr:P4 alpha zinc-binding domain-containing protein [Tianweitania aestuarii]MBS9720192.1 P4 alpha zinc-binding domain-containing protein [Tianweitania aestuarii]
MTSALDLFVEEARAVTIAEAAPRLGLKFSGKRQEHPGPCPHCGGTDTFAFNTAKNKWNCRAGGIGGQDAIGMAAHVLGLDQRSAFLDACSAVSGLPIPDEGRSETAEERSAREARLSDQKRRNEAEAARRATAQNAFRERERATALSILKAGMSLRSLPAGGMVGTYLRGRGAGVPQADWLRIHPNLPYFHGEDELGHPRAIWTGPAMVAAFLAADNTVLGCHITWIDVDAGTKLRPILHDPETGEVLPTKKMRGTKKGGFIPLSGSRSAERWLGGEGIENTLAAALAEGIRTDTFYFAAGDLGNLAGSADPASQFCHPTLTRTDKLGRVKPVMVAGPAPKPDQADDDAFLLPAHVTELMLLADGDSEPVMTASAMARAKARLRRPGLLTAIAWPKPGRDFAEMMATAHAQTEPALS